MKPLLVSLLVVSLLGNVLALLHALNARRPAESSPPQSRPQTRPVTEAEPASAVLTAADAARGGRWLAATLDELRRGDLRAGLQRLQATGLPQREFEALAEVAFGLRFQDALRQLHAADPESPYWRAISPWPDPEQHRRLLATWRELSEARIELGLDPGWWAGLGAGPRPPLPQGKAAMAELIARDYHELEGRLLADAQGLLLPSDLEALRQLAKERDRDFAALLTPEERFEWDLRRSETARALRHELAAFAPSEAEFRLLFALQSEFDREWGSGRWQPTGPEDWSRRQAAEERLRGHIREALGESRYADYERARHHEFRQLATLERRLNLPANTAREVFALRFEAEREAGRLAADPALDEESLRAAIRQHARQVRARVEQALGSEAAEWYLHHAGATWFRPLEEGRAIQFQGADSVRVIVPPRPRPRL
jgi:hypothetical protein